MTDLLASPPKKGDLRIWHMSQVPITPFYAAVSSVGEARKILEVLADYDLFQLKNKIKPDYSSAAGLEIYNPDDPFGDNGWTEWCDEEGCDVNGHL